MTLVNIVKAQLLDNMITLKQQVIEYLVAQRTYYGDEEVEISLEVLAIQNDHLSYMGALSKTLILRLIDDILLFTRIESSTIQK